MSLQNDWVSLVWVMAVALFAGCVDPGLVPDDHVMVRILYDQSVSDQDVPPAFEKGTTGAGGFLSVRIYGQEGAAYQWTDGDRCEPGSTDPRTNERTPPDCSAIEGKEVYRLPAPTGESMKAGAAYPIDSSGIVRFEAPGRVELQFSIGWNTWDRLEERRVSRPCDEMDGYRSEHLELDLHEAIGDLQIKPYRNYDRLVVDGVGRVDLAFHIVCLKGVD